MNKKGQLGILGAIFAIVIAFIFWAVAGADLLKEAGESAILEHGYTGFYALVLANINIFVFIGFVLGTLVVIGVGSR